MHCHIMSINNTTKGKSNILTQISNGNTQVLKTKKLDSKVGEIQSEAHFTVKCTDSTVETGRSRMEANATRLPRNHCFCDACLLCLLS